MQEEGRGGVDRRTEEGGGGGGERRREEGESKLVFLSKLNAARAFYAKVKRA